MQSTEIRPCDLCGGGLCPHGVSFHRVRFERYGLDRAALTERVGLHHLFQGRASAALIEALAPSGDVAILIHEPAELLVCESCALGERELPIMALAEIAHEQLTRRKAAAANMEAANDDKNPD